jgi:hypothetical protein
LHRALLAAVRFQRREEPGQLLTGEGAVTLQLREALHLCAWVRGRLAPLEAVDNGEEGDEPVRGNGRILADPSVEGLEPIRPVELRERGTGVTPQVVLKRGVHLLGGAPLPLDALHVEVGPHVPERLPLRVVPARIVAPVNRGQLLAGQFAGGLHVHSRHPPEFHLQHAMPYPLPKREGANPVGRDPADKPRLVGVGNDYLAREGHGHALERVIGERGARFGGRPERLRGGVGDRLELTIKGVHGYAPATESTHGYVPATHENAREALQVYALSA